jgi:response regulator RpfG family c-di-GMP phosphodiesterase
MSDVTLARILLVDDEPHVLDGLRRLLRTEFAIDTAADPALALERIRTAGPYAVVLSDFQMPQMNGAHFLAAARAASPDTSRILLTGQADLASAAAVVNEGGILRLLLKPAAREDLLDALRAGVDQYRLVTAERDLLDNTLRGSVRALTEVLALANPVVFARSTRLRTLVTLIVQASGTPVAWHVELAAMLTQIGAIALPAEILERAEQGLPLDAEARELLSRLPAIADQVLAGIPRIDEVRQAILSQGARYDGQAVLDERAGEAIPFGGRVLRVASDFDSLESAGTGPASALETMRARPGVYDPKLLDALASVVADRSRREPKDLQAGELEVGMMLAADVRTTGGLKLVAKGQELTPSLLERIANYARMASGIQEPVQVYVLSHQLAEVTADAH